MLGLSAGYTSTTAYCAIQLRNYGDDEEALCQALRRGLSVTVVRHFMQEYKLGFRDCFQTTDWDALCSPHGSDIDSMTHCITDYINFCVENTVPSKLVQCFPQNKYWLTSRLRPC